VSRIPGLLQDCGASRLVVITDSNLAATHASTVASLLKEAGWETELISFPAGEASKTRSTKETIEDRMLALGCRRDTAVVAVGGGVTGDLAGFVAATYMRGLPVLQAPTSLLAMADASIGGKTGVNHPRGKNLIGAFHAPLTVVADTGFLETLPRPEFTNGLAEVVKAGVIGDAALFSAMEGGVQALAAGEVNAVEEPLARAIRVKAEVVSGDYRESGRRRILNFGHTVGHALEQASGFALSHGEAVSSGMVAEARIAGRLGLMDRKGIGRLEGLLAGLGLPVEIPRNLDPGRILAAAEIDKKVLAGRLEFALPSGIGRTEASQGRWTRPILVDLLREVLEGGR
jgi:3-dehydroquinate synthase